MEMEHLLLSRAEGGLDVGDPDERPGFYKGVGIGLAIGSGVFIGISFVLKKVGLLRANEKYDEVAGEGYGYLRNGYWWGGMVLMILGEICNFVAYAFVDAILVTPLGALSVVITTILSAIFLKERLSMVGKVSCFLCIVGSVIIVMNAPHQSAVKDIQDMQNYVVAPGFLTFAGIVIVGSIVAAFWAAPKWGNRNMLVYISICSWIGGLSVVATQGLGASIIAWIGGKPQYKEWFLWVLLVFVVGTLLVEIVYLNKALNIFNAALVTPTYYVYFTSTTIITSAILFQGFKGTVEQIVSVVLGFLTICSGVVLLQLSKAAKDVPDTAVFKGDLDQMQTIAEQEQPESEPKADAIRGAAAIVRRVSKARIKMEESEFRRLQEEKMMGSMEVIDENGQRQAEYEWDGLRRRRTNTMGSRRPVTANTSQLSHGTTPQPPQSPQSPRSPHPPLGMSHFPDYDEDAADAHEHGHDNDNSTIFSSIAGSLMRGRARGRTTNTLPTYEEEDNSANKERNTSVPLNDVSGAQSHAHEKDEEAGYGTPSQQQRRAAFYQQDTAYTGSGTPGRSNKSGNSLKPPTPPQHSARRQFSFNRVWRRAQVPTEEESAGLVEGESDRRGSDEASGEERQNRGGYN